MSDKQETVIERVYTINEVKTLTKQLFDKFFEPTELTFRVKVTNLIAHLYANKIRYSDINHTFSRGNTSYRNEFEQLSLFYRDNSLNRTVTLDLTYSISYIRESLEILLIGDECDSVKATCEL